MNLLIHFKNKELFVALYFLLFILGFSLYGLNFYNELRVLEVVFLIGLGFYGIISDKFLFSIYDCFFIVFIVLGFLFWLNYYYIFYEIVLFYLLYKSFFSLDYNVFLFKILIWLSFLIFLMMPVAIVEFISNGIYTNWYPMPWNVRVYNSYFLVFSIFSVWFYLSEQKNKYLCFIFLAFLSILLDGGRSATLAYSVFIACVCIFNRSARLKVLLTYVTTWLVYFLILFFANNSNSAVRSITRESTSGRYELWLNAFQCWLNSPIFGCGFYQLDQYSDVISAHPHNLFIQVLTETGLVGFGFLILIICGIFRRITWNNKGNHFEFYALLAVSIELFFSGVYIYPITQVALLCFFVFLLKNPDFQNTVNFNELQYRNLNIFKNLGFIVYILISLAFIYLFFNTSVFSVSLPSTPPRFWEYGYQLF